MLACRLKHVGKQGAPLRGGCVGVAQRFSVEGQLGAHTAGLDARLAFLLDVLELLQALFRWICCESRHILELRILGGDGKHGNQG